MNVFFQLNPTKLIRWQAYFNEWEKHYLDDVSRNEWIAGGYTQRAVAACFSRSAKYPSDPVKFYSDVPAETEEDEEQHVFTDADRFFLFAQALNATIKDPEPDNSDDIDKQECP